MYGLNDKLLVYLIFCSAGESKLPSSFFVKIFPIFPPLGKVLSIRASGGFDIFPWYSSNCFRVKFKCLAVIPCSTKPTAEIWIGKILTKFVGKKFDKNILAKMYWQKYIGKNILAKIYWRKPYLQKIYWQNTLAKIYSGRSK